MKLRKWTSKIPISLLFSELGKNQKYNELGKKYVFNSEKKETYFKPIGNSAHTTEFLTLRKFDLLMFYPSRQWKYFKYKFEQVQQ